ncbi:hypothetical protein [Frigidibacter sp. ROC022]|uniref:hypothetical protein n=1 Tax=Frigidibacter sp. ROC022 TaxID=2971796 RepID=UPI00215B21B2|nr:hypothetical protein [Frigidibacter sp. ROC022]MCR8724187.1 hypothetical protein [Frigidibacter sp. ROC022]
MKKFAATAALVASFTASSAMAGGPGPVIIEDAPVIIEDAGSSSSAGSLGAGGVIGALLLLGVVAAIASSSD